MPQFQSIPIIADRQAVRLEPFKKNDPAASTSPTSAAGAIRATSTSGNRGVSSSGALDAALADGELSPDEVGALQEAAAKNDPEALDYLKQLGLPLGIAAGVAGAAGVGYAIKRSMRNRAGYKPSDVMEDGSPKFYTAGTDEFDRMFPKEPGAYYKGEMTNIVPISGVYASGGDQRGLEDMRYGRYNMPGDGPMIAITDETGTRYHQAGPDIRGSVDQAMHKALPAPPLQIEDQRAARFRQPAPVEPLRLEDKGRPAREAAQKASEVEAAYAAKAAQDAEELRRIELQKQLGPRFGKVLRRAASIARGKK